MKRILASIVAAGVLAVGAFAAVSITASDAEAQVDDRPTETTVTDESTTDRPTPFADILDELVADGTLSQDQADAVLERFRTAWEDRADEREARRERFQQHRRGHFMAQVERLLEDGVITADEIAELPERHPFNNPDGAFAELLEDGQITQAEWDEWLEAHQG